MLQHVDLTQAGLVVERDCVQARGELGQPSVARPNVVERGAVSAEQIEELDVGFRAQQRLVVVLAVDVGERVPERLQYL
jgi:hypothetical protein